MCGQRPTMEDCLLVKGNYLDKTDTDLFAIFDGHAGSIAAKYSAKQFPGILAEKLKVKLNLFNSF